MRNPFDDLVPPSRWPELGWRAYLAIALALIFLPPIACTARAAGGLGFTTPECRAFAKFARTSAEIRDLEAKMEKHVDLMRSRIAAVGMKLSPVVERELRRVYAEGLAPEDAETSAYTRCMAGEILRGEI